MRRRKLWLAVAAVGIALALSRPEAAAKKPAEPPPQPANPAIAYLDAWRLKVVDADGANVTTIRQDAINWASIAPSWSPDGSHIAYNNGGYRLWRCDPDGGNVVEVVPRDDSSHGLLHEVAWSPQGDDIAFTCSGPNQGLPTQIRLVSPNGGTPETAYTSADDREIHGIAFDPAGGKIAFIRWANGGEATILDLATGTTTVFYRFYRQSAADPIWEQLDWARTKDVLAFRETGTGLLCTYDLSSNTLTKLFTGSDPSWSPDDSQLVYAVNGGLSVYTFATGRSGRLVANKAGRPDWKR